MKIVVTISLLLMAGLCLAQDKDGQKWPPPPTSVPSVLAANQEKAKPDFNLPDYLKSTLKYPMAALQAEIEGRVVVEFIVEKDGRVANVRVVRGKELGGGLPEEAIRVTKNMPLWKPATQNGQVVRSFMTLPIDFKIDKPVMPDSRYQFPVDKEVTLSQGASPTFDYNAYIKTQMNYPQKASANNVEGLVVVKFIVEKDRRISNISIIEGQQLGAGLPEEAKRLIGKMPAWLPALDSNKKPVRSYVIAPVFFKIAPK